MNPGMFPNQAVGNAANPNPLPLANPNANQSATSNPNQGAIPGHNPPANGFEPTTVLLDQISSDIDRELRAAPNYDSFLAGKTLAEIERCAIIATIRACKGNKAASARSLGISEKSIYNKMKRLAITNSDIFGNL